MVEQIKSDLTSGKISTHFRNLAVPMAIGMVFYTLYNMVGIFFAGKLSTSAQAAIGIGHLVFFFLMAFASNLIFSFFDFPVPVYVITTGLLLSIFILVAYAIIKAKQ